MQLVSFIVPVLNESASIEKTLLHLETVLQSGHQLIIVDGGSSDDTLEKCRQYAVNKDSVKLLSSAKGRAKQMNIGAANAANNTLFFLHADTLIPENIIESIFSCHDNKEHLWGFFKVKLSGNNKILKLVSYFINLRSCFTSIATGDQGIFVSKALFESINGYKEIPLMEDIELSRSLKKYSSPFCVNNFVITSARKWESEGVVKTIILMWKLRLLYSFGVSSHKLVKLYYK